MDRLRATPRNTSVSFNSQTSNPRALRLHRCTLITPRPDAVVSCALIGRGLADATTAAYHSRACIKLWCTRH